jgi:hypothetical protein
MSIRPPAGSVPSPTPFGDHLGVHKPHPLGGDQWLFKFANSYGASVVRFNGSYGGTAGRWELAVLNAADQIDYDTPITDDVIGWLDEDEVAKTLTAIAALPAAELARVPQP